MDPTNLGDSTLHLGRLAFNSHVYVLLRRLYIWLEFIDLRTCLKLFSVLNFEGRTWSTTGLSSNLSTRKISLARSLPVIKFSGSQFTINSPEWTISLLTRFPIGQIPFHFRTLSKKIGKALWILTIVLRNAKLYFSPLLMKIQMK